MISQVCKYGRPIRITPSPIVYANIISDDGIDFYFHSN